MTVKVPAKPAVRAAPARRPPPGQRTGSRARLIVSGTDGIGEEGWQHGEPAGVDRGQHPGAEGEREQRAHQAVTLASAAPI
jgi:hypothetical protein